MPQGRVVIVDDYAEALESLALVVEGWGYEVEGTRTGAEALRILARKPPPTAAIVDLALPDIAGCEIIRRMKTVVPGIVVIAHSGHHELRARALGAGADAFVLKPDFEVIEDVLARRALASRGAV